MPREFIIADHGGLLAIDGGHEVEERQRERVKVVNQEGPHLLSNLPREGREKGKEEKWKRGKEEKRRRKTKTGWILIMLLRIGA